MVRPILVRQWPYQFLREKKLRRLDSNLCVRYWIAVCRSLGRLNYDKAFLGLLSSLQASKVAMRGLRLLIFNGDILALDKCAKWGGANMCEMLVWGGNFRQLCSITSKGFTSYRNYRWRDPNRSLAQTWPQRQSQSAQFFLGEHAPHTPLAIKIMCCPSIFIMA